MDIAQEMLTTFKDKPDLLKKVIIGDESLVSHYNIELNAQSSEWKHPEEQRPKTAAEAPSNVKVFLRLKWRGAS